MVNRLSSDHHGDVSVQPFVDQKDPGLVTAPHNKCDCDRWVLVLIYFVMRKYFKVL
jgi:hypothetical protein